jgi:hypothetical protein
MLKTLGVLAVIVVVVIAGILVYAATKPDSFRVERTLAMKAPAAKILPMINDLKAMAAWSPYEKKDPAMKRTYGAVTAGKGATYAWDGDKNVGQGSMEILESSPDKVVLRLDFIKPFEAHNTGEFILKPKGDVTDVTWAIHGPSPYVSKVITIFVDFDKMIGKDFEQGLADLKATVEK